MPLDDNDRKEIEGLIAKTFGAPEGKTLSEHLASEGEARFNAILNKYDKRQSKDRDDLKKTLGTLTDSLKELKEGKEGEGDEPEGAGDGKGGKKPPADSPEVKKLQNEMRKLNEKLESAQKERETEKAEREKLEAATAHRAMLDAVRTRALSKDVGVDPEKLPFLLDHIDHNALVRLNEGKTGYEFAGGKDKLSGETIWETLEEGLQKFVKTGPGSFFLPPVKGASGPGSGGGRPGAGAPGGAEPTKSVDLIKAGLARRGIGQQA